MALKPRDPLLAFARAFITVSLWLTGVITGLLALLVPAVLLGGARILIKVSSRAAVIDNNETLGMIAGLLMLLAVIGALIFLFLVRLRRVIDTVTQGDPFVPANAERLAQMGWLVLATQALAFPAGTIGALLAMRFEKVHIGFGVSLGAILLALILFILARVFRTGAQMREELEGTV
jgi:hypothetical protein